MSGYIKVYIVSLVIFLLIDAIWLGIVGRDFYRNQLGYILKEEFDLLTAGIFYIFFVAGLVYFVVNRAVMLNSWQYALFAGMFFGFITYGTYDMTNLSTLRDWPVIITVVDIVWGTILCGITSWLGYVIVEKWV